MTRTLLIFSIFILYFNSCKQTETPILNLSGEWAFAIDPSDAGISEQWYNKPLQDTIKLPGSLQEQGYGDDVTTNTLWTGQVVDSAWFNRGEYEKYRKEGNIKIPFWLQPEKHYVGVAWYQREVEIPENWKGKYVELELERAHWQTTLFINGNEAGKNDALLTPHRYVIHQTGKILLTIRVDNRIHIPVGVNAHSVSDHTQSNWNGVVGNISISARPNLHIDDVQVYPDVKNKKARIVVSITGDSKDKNVKLRLSTKQERAKMVVEINPVNLNKDTTTIETMMEMGDNMKLWSEYEPNLYHMDVELFSNEGKDKRTVSFGMREFKVQGTRFSVNDVPVFLRGTLECAIFPLTGYASMDPAYWEKIYKRCKEFGLNHVRFHSWCPPQVAFEVADREGIYLQVECGAWTNVGDGGKIDEWIFAEAGRILKEYGNHPSFCMMTYGNEPGGVNQVDYLSRFVDEWKTKDPRRVYTSAAGWPYVSNADYWNTPDPRIQHWGAELNSIINAEPPRSDYDFRGVIQSKTMPTVSHEIGQWCVYPNFKEIDKYTGILKPRNFEIFKETLNEHHMGDLADQFLYASGRLQTLCYKADIEAALRTPGFAGFQLLDLHDFPGQGTALVGVLDPFWDPKGYVDGAEYSTFCNRTVPLVRLSKMVWMNNETLKAPIEVAHFDKQPLTDATVEWEIKNALGKVLATGKSVKSLPVGNCIPITDIQYDLSSVTEPSQLVLSVRVTEANAMNQWNIWVYPAHQPEILNRSYITTNYEDAIVKAKAGANVLFCLPKNTLKAEKGGEIKVGFSSIFWNTAWTRKQAPHELGIYCDPGHPAFSLFPNNGYSDYQWWEIVSNCSAMVLDDFPADYRPIIHLIDDWFTNRKLGILFETKVGKGKLMVCSVDLTKEIDKRPAARQFKQSIEHYMSSGQFNPMKELDLSVMKNILK